MHNQKIATQVEKNCARNWGISLPEDGAMDWRDEGVRALAFPI
jgi:hypothetical protein